MGACAEDQEQGRVEQIPRSARTCCICRNKARYQSFCKRCVSLLFDLGVDRTVWRPQTVAGLPVEMVASSQYLLRVNLINVIGSRDQPVFRIGTARVASDCHPQFEGDGQSCDSALAWVRERVPMLEFRPLGGPSSARGPGFRQR